MTRYNDENELVGQVEAASRAVSLLKWIAPRGLDSIRAELCEAVETGASQISRWEYEEVDTETSVVTFDRLRRDVQESPVPDRILQLVDPFLDAQSRIIDLVRERDDDKFMSWSVEKYGLPTAEATEAAEKCLDTLPDDSLAEATIDAIGALTEVIQLLDNLGLAGTWQVETRDQMASRMSVLPLSRRIYIRSDVVFSRSEMRRLLAHEVYGHVLRSEFSQRQNNPWARLPLGAATETEEGLATWTEAQLGVSSIHTLHTYALRLLAVDAARLLGIVDVLNFARQFVDTPSAIEIAIRVKRGLLDPNRPGVFAKDQFYHSGCQKVSRNLELEPENYELLMATKWGLETLPLVRDMVLEGDLMTDYSLADLESARDQVSLEEV